MTWVKIDDGFPDHPKIAGLSLRSKWMHIRGLCYAARFLTDGTVPTHVAKSWGSAAELMSAGLWAEGEAGYVIHDFLLYNPSREQVENDRRSSRERMARVRQNTGTGSSEDSKGNEFEEFWLAYPKHVGKRAAERAFVAACKRVAVAEILAGAQRYRDDPNRRPDFTKHPATWLNGDCWLDEGEVIPPPEPDRPIHVAEEPDADELERFSAAVRSMPWVGA